MGTMLALLAPVIPEIYNTEPHVRAIATKLLYVVAVFMPAYSFSHCCYFTLRSGGRTMITFFFDSIFTWGVNVSVAWVLAYKTNMDIVPLYFCVQALEMIKVSSALFWSRRASGFIIRYARSQRGKGRVECLNTLE